MDQLKVFLKQCVKYRFWIAVGVSVLLPVIGYFVGSGTINAETTKREGEIKNAKTEISKYTTPGIVNNQYQPEAAKKKDVLVQDVDATWRKLFASQEPLLKWPPEVAERFRQWGRKYPQNVDSRQVQSTLIDYTVAYPQFVDNIYKVFKPFNFDDGSGIVVAPDSDVLLRKAQFLQDSPPDLSVVWAEQERLWVVTALLDAIAKVNDAVGAKDWDGAVVKQINLLEVGSGLDQDQKSIAKGETLVAADAFNPDGTVAPAPPPATTSPAPGGMPGPGSLGASQAKTNEVLYIKTDSPQFKTLPIKLTVLVDQGRLQNYLVGLENSPMAVEVCEVEIAKPLGQVNKPAYGEKASFNLGGGSAMVGGGGRGDEMVKMGGAGGSIRGMAGGNRPPGYPGGGGGAGGEAGPMANAGRGGTGASTKTKTGVDNRGKNDAKARADRNKKEKEASAKKVDAKKIDQYYNVIEVTVYGRARFYLAPPPQAQPEPSTAPAPAPSPEPAAPPASSPAPAATPAPAPDAAKAQTPAPDAAKKDEAPKAETPAPKADEPKGDTPKGEPTKGETPAPKR